MSRRVLVRSFVALLGTGLLALLAAAPAQAYGQANWQIGFAGTGTAPASLTGSTAAGAGFWGWCEFAGGTSSGNSGDCEFAQYFHSSAGGFTCQESLDITKWEISPSAALGGLPTFHADGTATVHPASLTDPCLAFFPMQPSPFTDADTLLPGFPGHFDLGPLFGVGELQITVTQIR